VHLSNQACSQSILRVYRTIAGPVIHTGPAIDAIPIPGRLQRSRILVGVILDNASELQTQDRAYDCDDRHSPYVLSHYTLATIEASMDNAVVPSTKMMNQIDAAFIA
jgi:hypothetical protein